MAGLALRVCQFTMVVWWYVLFNFAPRYSGPIGDNWTITAQQLMFRLWIHCMIKLWCKPTKCNELLLVAILIITGNFRTSVESVAFVRLPFTTNGRHTNAEFQIIYRLVKRYKCMRFMSISRMVLPSLLHKFILILSKMDTSSYFRWKKKCRR